MFNILISLVGEDDSNKIKEHYYTVMFYGHLPILLIVSFILFVVAGYENEWWNLSLWQILTYLAVCSIFAAMGFAVRMFFTPQIRLIRMGTELLEIVVAMRPILFTMLGPLVSLLYILILTCLLYTSDAADD